MQENENTTCPFCQIGRAQLKLVTFSQVYGRTLVSVPNTPAWECDFCHVIQYDTGAISRIEALVGQAGPPPNRSRQHPVSLRMRAGSARSRT
ncbi:MAG: YgiT-type zinc finger protein [Anaerolineae bacterium]|nr:YgiT-type zinc finger protein [Anaerolineae bacterium]